MFVALFVQIQYGRQITHVKSNHNRVRNKRICSNLNIKEVYEGNMYEYEHYFTVKDVLLSEFLKKKTFYSFQRTASLHCAISTF